MFRTFLISLFSAFAIMSMAPAASAMPVDTAPAASVAGSSAVTEVRLVCNRWGRCFRTRPAYFVPPIYYGSRRYYGGGRYYGGRVYHGGRHYRGGRPAWRNAGRHR